MTTSPESCSYTNLINLIYQISDNKKLDFIDLFKVYKLRIVRELKNVDHRAAIKMIYYLTLRVNLSCYPPLKINSDLFSVDFGTTISHLSIVPVV